MPLEPHIVAATGGFGNHLRWLLLLDDQFEFTVPNRNDEQITLKTQKQKINFIANEVYDLNRHCQNWLHYEWRFRKNCLNCIPNDHHLTVGAMVNSEALLLCTVEPMVALKHYIPMNIDLNDSTPRDFIETIEIHNDTMEKLDKLLLGGTLPKSMLVDNTTLYHNSVLPKNYYHDIISFLGLDDNYKLAAQLHEMWGIARNRAVTE